MDKRSAILQLSLLVLLLSSCSRIEHAPDNNNNSPSLVVTIQNVYNKTGFMDQVKASAQDQDCVATDAFDITDCIQTNGSWKVTVPDVTSCTGLTITETLDLFNWTCSEADGVVIFSSTMKAGISLVNFLNPGAFKLNSLTIKDARGETVAYTDPSAWFTDPVHELPVSTTGTAAIYLNTAGIYTFGPSASPIMTNMIILDADKIAVVGLQNAELKFNAGCIDLGIGDLLCATLFATHDFSYIEGKFISPPADINTRNYTLGIATLNLFDPTTYARFADIKNIELIKGDVGDGSWGTADEPEGIIMMGDYHRVSGTLTADGLIALDIGGPGSNGCLISADITAGNSYKPGINIQAGSLNTFSGNINVSNIGTAGISIYGDENLFTGNINTSDTTDNGIRLSGSQNIFNGDINISDSLTGSGIYFTGVQNTINSNITIDNVSGGIHFVGATQNNFNGTINITNDLNLPFAIQNGSDNNTFNGVINIDGAPMGWAGCVDISDGDGSGGIGVSSNSNIINGALNLSNCSIGIFIRKSNNNSINGLATIHDVISAIYLIGDAQFNSIPLINPSSNIVSYDVLIAEDLGVGPANNEVRSFDASVFNSCGNAPYVAANTTDCP